jgi:hypothetical protein
MFISSCLYVMSNKIGGAIFLGSCPLLIPSIPNPSFFLTHLLCLLLTPGKHWSASPQSATKQPSLPPFINHAHPLNPSQKCDIQTIVALQSPHHHLLEALVRQAVGAELCPLSNVQQRKSEAIFFHHIISWNGGVYLLRGFLHHPILLLLTSHHCICIVHAHAHSHAHSHQHCPDACSDPLLLPRPFLLHHLPPNSVLCLLPPPSSFSSCRSYVRQDHLCACSRICMSVIPP